MISNIDRLLNAGKALADISFNLAQKPGHVLQDDWCLSLGAARREWDLARVAYAESTEAAAPPPALSLEPTPEMGEAVYAAWDKFGEDAVMGPEEAIAICRAVLAAAQPKEQP